MRTIVFSIIGLISLSFAACGGNQKKSAADYSDIFGLWVQQEPQTAAKWEIMFTEDSTGFVFVADTFHCGISWLPGSSFIDVKYNYTNSGAESSITKRLKPFVTGDTLLLQEIAADGTPSLKSKYIRFKQ